MEEFRPLILIHLGRAFPQLKLINCFRFYGTPDDWYVTLEDLQFVFGPIEVKEEDLLADGCRSHYGAIYNNADVEEKHLLLCVNGLREYALRIPSGDLSAKIGNFATWICVRIKWKMNHIVPYIKYHKRFVPSETNFTMFFGFN